MEIQKTSPQSYGVTKVTESAQADIFYLCVLRVFVPLWLSSSAEGGYVLLNTIRALYETLLGREITGEELEELFRMPWIVLLSIVQITGVLDALCEALKQIEAA